MEERLHNRRRQQQNQHVNGFRLYVDQNHDEIRDEEEGNGSDDSASGDSNESTSELWVFGYGSLCWFPGFEYTKCVTGYIRGYVRRFWQGNTTHRGTKEKPGRVVTLVKETDGITWGCAYKITGSTALNYLKQRECTLGGYTTLYSKFYPRVAADDMELCGEAFPTLLYIATEKNSLWMGDTPLPIIAQEIADSQGASGHNVEYLIRLANFMREELKGVVVDDEHLFQLEQIVRDILAERKICVYSLMGRQPERIERDSHEEIRRPTTFEFSSRVPDKKLRCLNI
ncbi:glutathione-specific gamma-glutamylcyclotransferase 1 [Sitodiplosis mosellana]|uniref:glutathione-specific gamma-glutamylcyclotransferase 1 n=1 Tax=Sitodiplosis mosellana TaxID=263140 RepID=UPI0024448D85|nr:glutathione-specific gamma-glutamylcyclotransferase 1 [Sitodiplosis mosellana]